MSHGSFYRLFSQVTSEVELHLCINLLLGAATLMKSHRIEANATPLCWERNVNLFVYAAPQIPSLSRLVQGFTMVFVLGVAKLLMLVGTRVRLILAILFRTIPNPDPDTNDLGLPIGNVFGEGLASIGSRIVIGDPPTQGW